MPLTLVQLLAARGLAQVDLQAAEARRVKLGGGLETSLLELGVLEEAKIGELWSEASRLPRPPPELLKDVSSAMASLFPQQLAERYGMVPLGLVRRQLSLLAKHPVDLSTLDEISFLLSRPLKLFVGTELEIAELLGTVYGVAVPQRFKDLRLKIKPALVAPAPVSAESAPASAPAETAAPDPVAPASASADSASAQAVVEAAPAVAPPDEPAPAPVLAEVAPALVAPDSVPAATGEAVSIESALASMAEPTEGEPAPITLPPKRSMSPEPWSINLPLREPPSASSRAAEPGAQSGSPAQAWKQPAPQFAMPETGAEASRARPEPDPAFDPPPPFAAVPVPVRAAVPEPQAAPQLAAISEPSSAEPSPAEPSLAVPSLAEPSWGERTEPSPAEPPPIEPSAVPPPAEQSPFEATPLSSGYGARLGQEHRMSVGEALAALREEQSRDGVIGVAVDFLRGAFDFVAVFVRREDTFEVFEATGIEYGGGADLTQTVVDIDRSRVLRTVVEGKAPYVGPIPPGDPLEAALGALGRGRLRAVLMYPVVIRDRTIAVVHGDRGGEALAPRQLSDVALVLSQLGAQLERVIRERRQGRRAEPPRKPAPLPAVPAEEISQAAAPVATAQPAPAIAAPSAPPEPPIEEPTAPAPVVAPAAPHPPPPPAEAFSMAPPAAEEEDREALGAAEHAQDEEEPFEVPIEWLDASQGAQMADQVRAFLSGDPPARAAAAEALRAGGEEAAWALGERFPGPLFVFRMTIDELPGPDAMGPVMGLMAQLGPAALPALSDLAESNNEERRFWATMLIAKTGDHAAVPVLARRLLDSSPDVALAARRGLWRLRKAPEFAQVLQQATSELNGADPERALPLIRALGQFRHVPAIPLLIGLLSARDSQVSQAANEALREIARQDFGTSERRWSAWWEQSRSMPRLHWMIDALEDRDRDLRLAAISELTELTGFDFGYRSDLDPGKQGPALERWREWLERDGRARATPMPFPASG